MMMMIINDNDDNDDDDDDRNKQKPRHSDPLVPLVDGAWTLGTAAPPEVIKKDKAPGSKVRAAGAGCKSEGAKSVSEYMASN